jgi:hypothetical protein
MMTNDLKGKTKFFMMDLGLLGCSKISVQADAAEPGLRIPGIHSEYEITFRIPVLLTNHQTIIMRPSSNGVVRYTPYFPALAPTGQTKPRCAGHRRSANME